MLKRTQSYAYHGYIRDTNVLTEEDEIVYVPYCITDSYTETLSRLNTFFKDKAYHPIDIMIRREALMIRDYVYIVQASTVEKSFYKAFFIMNDAIIALNNFLDKEYSITSFGVTEENTRVYYSVPGGYIAKLEIN